VVDIYGEYALSFQLWDIRRKGCIFTYKGHKLTVNSLKFSPDGQWIASAGEEGLVKVMTVIVVYILNCNFILQICTG
jgi:katanin p80 WD40 repeat-containing subunit B1